MTRKPPDLTRSDTVIPDTIVGISKHVTALLTDGLAAIGAADFGHVVLVKPPDPKLGHLGFPCFALAGVLRRAPHLIAQELASSLAPDHVVEAVQADKAYINFAIRPEVRAQSVLAQALRAGAEFGRTEHPTGQRWIVEYSSPNTNKPLHLGHLRNNLLGASVAALLRFIGHDVVRINLINDRGIHISKSMVAYQRWGAGSDPVRAGQKGDAFVGALYVRFEREFVAEYQQWLTSSAGKRAFESWQAEQEVASPGSTKRKVVNKTADTFEKVYRDRYFNSISDLGMAAQDLLRSWEDEDPGVRELWQRMNTWVMDGFDETYRRMGVAFDATQFESETYLLGKTLVADGLARGFFRRRDDGAIVCPLNRIGGPEDGEKVLLRSDGTSVYITQDLGTALQRMEHYRPDHMIYVVGDEQNYHFDLLFKILGLFEDGLESRCRHLAYGMIRLPDGKMKSREGTVVDADGLMDEVFRLAREETRSRAEAGRAHTEGISESELTRRADAIGMAALKYFLLKFSPKTSFEYDPKASIEFLGQTGPYALFNYARTRSLLRKVALIRATGKRSASSDLDGRAMKFDPAAAARLTSESEQELITRVSEWPECVRRAAEACDPSRVTEYVFDLCRSFAFLFSDKANHPIVECEDRILRDGRLMLVEAVGNTIKAALTLLGIDVLEEM